MEKTRMIAIMHFPKKYLFFMIIWWSLVKLYLDFLCPGVLFITEPPWSWTGFTSDQWNHSNENLCQTIVDVKPKRERCSCFSFHLALPFSESSEMCPCGEFEMRWSRCCCDDKKCLTPFTIADCLPRQKFMKEKNSDFGVFQFQASGIA